jgi:hypothetical protein
MNYDFNIGGGLNSRLHDASSHEAPTVSPSRLTWLAGCSTKPPGQNSGCSSIPQEPGNQNSSRKTTDFLTVPFRSRAYLRTSTADSGSPSIWHGRSNQVPPSDTPLDGTGSLDSRPMFSSGPPWIVPWILSDYFDLLLRSSVHECL